MPDEKLTNSIHIRISDALKKQIEEQARIERRRLSDMIRLLLERALTINDRICN